MSSTISEAKRDSDLHPQYHIIPLEFDSVKTVPDSYVWPESDDTDESDNIDDRLSIPTINLMDPDAAKLIRLACETWGMFQIINHDIPLKLFDEVESEARRLFSLPTQQKLEALRSSTGFTGYGRARISEFYEKHMWHEGFTIMGSPIDHAKQLWPHDYLRFCKTMEEYQKKIKELAKTLMHKILKSLNISEEETKWVHSPEAAAGAALQLNSYPLCPEPSRAIGLAPHTDTCLLTILHQGNVSGLQIFKEGIGWVKVYPTSGALVVNVGDLLHILSNARFHSVVHRVVMKEARQRLSVAYFYSLKADMDVSPLGLDSGEIPRFRSLSVKEYHDIKYKNFDKALALIRI